MARPEYFIQDGLIVTKSNTDSNSSSNKGLFDLSKWFKRLLVRYHIAFVDDCCDSTVDPTAAPLRFNRSTGHIQYYNADNDTWTNATL